MAYKTYKGFTLTLKVLKASKQCIKTLEHCDLEGLYPYMKLH